MLTVLDLKVLASKIIFIPLVPLEAEQESPCGLCQR